MNEKVNFDTPIRKKREIDFLDHISEPIHLYADGSVGELEKRTVERTATTRHEQKGRELTRTVRVKQLAETTVHKTLAEYVAANRQRVIERGNKGDDEWKVSPNDEGWKAFETWRDSSGEIRVEDIVLRSHTLSEKSWEIDEDETVDCAHCPQETKYACYSSGWSREVYQYPLVRYVDDEGQNYDVPMNVANLIAIRNRVLQEPLDIKTTHSFGSDGSLSAEKYLTLDLSTIPRSYAAGRPMPGDVHIHPSEPLSDGVNVLIDAWTEHDDKPNILRHRRGIDKIELTPDGILEHLQYRVTQNMYHERVESVDYDERLDELRKKVGELGLALTYQLRYAGMGNTDASFALAKPERGFKPLAYMTYSMDAREGVDDALEYLLKNKTV